MTTTTNLTLGYKMYTIDFSRPTQSNEALLDFFRDVQHRQGNNAESFSKTLMEIEEIKTKYVDHEIVQLAKSLEQQISRSNAEKLEVR
ncbi:hypothetical protein [Priestia megaterium]|uniref:hypothetical protein n=2 Tax=Priestia megaterium TaxID=1404 RepID=UPI00101C7B2D|nr:hypothetical protein [Priestia megaterium]